MNIYRTALILGLVTLLPAAAPAPDPFAKLAIYPGTWSVRATKSWSGAKPGMIDTLISRCHRYTAYFACEQTIAGKPTIFVIYTRAELAKDGSITFNTRFISPAGLAGGRGEMVLTGNRWTYTDKPPAGLTGNWSRTINIIVSRNHIRFEEYESADEGRTWQLTNAGDEWRVGSRR